MFTINKLRPVFTKGLIVGLIGVGACLTIAVVANSEKDPVKEGERLVHNMDCNVCHTPKIMTEKGPQPDMSRLLSGHPADEKLPPIPKDLISPTGWGGLFNHSLTAWVGPWGVSYASNLTPDTKTGIGTWSDDMFIMSMRKGLHMGQARAFLPPMPTYDQLSDYELSAMYAYLRSIQPVSNEVPKPQPPVAASPEAATQPSESKQ